MGGRNLVLAAVVIFFAAQNARADIDQSNTISWVGQTINGLSVTNRYSEAQTFTVGSTGQLNRVDLQVGWHWSFKDADLVISVTTTTGGAPSPFGAGILATASLPSSSVPSASGYPNSPPFVSIDFSSANLQVNQGDQLAIVLSTTTTWGYGWACTFSGSGQYNGGQAYSLTNGGAWSGSPTIDAGFKTYVAPVPEPASLALFGIGVPALLIRRPGREPRTIRLVRELRKFRNSHGNS